MIYSYYPGCTLKTKAKELDRYARLSAQALGIELVELPDWQCCGAVYPMARDEVGTRLSSVRALMAARELDRPLVTLCSACHHVIKRVNGDMARDEEIRDKVNAYLGEEPTYAGETRVLHYLELLRDQVGFDQLKKKVVNPLKGKKIGAYYGCMLLRPGAEMEFDNPENPTVMEDFIRALGAEPVLYPYRNECCGGYITLENNDLAQRKCTDITTSATEKGAQALITACPLCMYNVSANALSNKLPVHYFTELLARALGVV
jgi:heterodisulfide reductase subunit B